MVYQRRQHEKYGMIFYKFNVDIKAISLHYSLCLEDVDVLIRLPNCVLHYVLLDVWSVVLLDRLSQSDC
jgi:hypothetical protein